VKTREEAAKYVETLMSDGSAAKNIIPRGPHHFGKLEIRELFDYIWGGPPLDKKEEVFEPLKLRNAKVGKWREE